MSSSWPKALRGSALVSSVVELLFEAAADGCGSLSGARGVYLKNMLRHILGADLITHQSLEYYD